jgi:hypothetical protein
VKLTGAIKEVFSELLLFDSQVIITKAVQLYQTPRTRHAVMLVDPTDGGKITTRNALSLALKKQ